jgi:hypothetical protein
MSKAAKPAKPSHARPEDWKNVLLSPQTQGMIEEIQQALAGEDALGERPSKHRVIAVALRELLDRRRRS